MPQCPVLAFGGEFGEGDETEISNELYSLRFDHDNYSDPKTPGLTISKL